MCASLAYMSAVLALVPSGPALAQSLPPETERALWCAQGLIAAATSPDSELGKRGTALLARLQIQLLEQGYSDGQIDALSASARERARDQLLSGLGEPQYSYEECLIVSEGAQ